MMMLAATTSSSSSPTVLRPPPPPPPQPREDPAGVAAEAQLLAALADAPTVTRAFLLPEDDGGDPSKGSADGDEASTTSTTTLVVEWAQRDLPSNRPRRFLRSHALVRDRAARARRALLSGGLQANSLAGDVVLSTPSPSGKRQLVVRSVPSSASGGGAATGNKPAPPSVSVEVWGEGRCLLDLCVPAALHGAIYAGAWFGDGGPSWSEDEERIAYVAESPPRVETPEWGGAAQAGHGHGYGFGGEQQRGTGAFLDLLTLRDKDEAGERERDCSEGDVGGGVDDGKKHSALPRTWKGLGERVADWGEQLTGREKPAVFVLDIPTATVFAAPAPPKKAKRSDGDGADDRDDDDDSSSSQGQPALSRCGSAVVYVSWPHSDDHNLYPGLGKQRLGMVYCTNRPCSLWLARLPSRVEASPPPASAAGGGGAPPPPPPPPRPTPPAAPLPPPRCLTPTLLSAMSPRFSPLGTRLAFLSHDAAVSSGAHFATVALLSLPFDPETAEPFDPEAAETSSEAGGAGEQGQASRPHGRRVPEPRVVVPVVDRPEAKGSSFPGIYCASLPDRPFLSERALALTSQWGCSTEVVLVDLETGEVACASSADKRGGEGDEATGERRRDDDGDRSGVGAGGASGAAFPGSWALLAALPPRPSGRRGRGGESEASAASTGGGGWLAAVVSSPTCPPDVVVADLSSALSEAEGRGPEDSPPSLPPSVAAVAGGLRWRRASRADGSPPPLRRPAAEALSGVSTTVLRVRVPPPGPRPRPRVERGDEGEGGEERGDEGEGGEERGDEGEGGEERGAPSTIEVLVVSPRPRSGRPPPALVVPHGGPHAAHADGWALPTSFLAACGYCVLLVNFRGSTGYGEESLQLLPGRIGTLDVGDCVAALEAASSAGLADAGRAAAVGGSHGGFLAANLLGMHPELFKAGVLRNPVLDLSLMAAVSDIPEWAFVEAWGGRVGRARARACPAREDLERFASVSPIAHVDRVTSPLLVLLGGRDRRVPLEDASRYLCALRGRRAAAAAAAASAASDGGVVPQDLPPPPPRTRALVFPNDAHALDSPQTEFEAWLNAAAWLKEHVA